MLSGLLHDRLTGVRPRMLDSVRRASRAATGASDYAGPVPNSRRCGPPSVTADLGEFTEVVVLDLTGGEASRVRARHCKTRPADRTFLCRRAAAVEDVRVTNRISTLISAFGVLGGAMFLFIGIGEYQAGASALWAVGGALVLLIAVYALVRDLRAAGKPVAGRDGEGRAR
ncbi:hypothetical protein GCM10023079_33870 [Streptomyces chitinivorans]